jgi:hypothetical protein
MSAKTNIFNFRTMLIVLFLVLIVVGISYFILGSSDEKEVLTLNQVLNNEQRYLGEEIIVEGYYHRFVDDEHSLIKATFDSDPDPIEWLTLDISNLDNATQILTDDKKYHITGILQEVVLNPNIPSLTEYKLIVIDAKEAG